MRPLLPAAALALLAACAPPPEPPTPAPAPVEVTTTSTEAYEKYTEAWRLVVESGDHRVIIAPLREALALDPEFAMAWRLLAVTLLALGDSSQAEEAMEHAVRLGDRVSETERLHIEGTYALRRSDLVAALSAFDRILDLNSRDVLAHFNRAVTLRRLGRDAEALDAYDRVIQLNPRFRSAHSNRAAALQRLGRYAESFESFKRGSFGRILEEYFSYPPQKAIALARDSAGRWAAWYKHSNRTNAEAIERAISECTSAAVRYRVRSQCRLYAVGDEVVWGNDPFGQEAPSLGRYAESPVSPGRPDPLESHGIQFRRPPLQTTVAEPVARRIYLKLPLQHVRFHWRFMSREDLLSGKLMLRVRRGDLTNEIVIFENGAIAPGWEPIPAPTLPGEIYFGFRSTTTFLTAPDDELEVELLVLKDLAGIGVRQTGVLAAGTYRAKGTYFGLQDDFDSSQLLSAAQMIDSLTGQGQTREDAARVAQTLQGVSLAMRKNAEAFSFIAGTGCWDNLWPLKITSNEGWASPEQVAFQERMSEIEKVAIEREGEPGWNCSGPA